MKEFGEAKRWNEGREGGTFYAEDLILAKEEKRLDATYPKIIRASEMAWEDSPQGRLKHIAHPKLNPRVKDIDAYIQEIPPGSRSGKHRHMAEEYMFILEGKGYSLHWDVEMELGEKYSWKVPEEPQRFDWEAGDWVYVPVNTIHQHFNADPDKRSRFISATCRLYKMLGWHDLEQLEEAPRP